VKEGGGRAAFPAAFAVSEEPETQELFVSRKEVVGLDQAGRTRPVVAKGGKNHCYVSSVCRGYTEKINNNKQSMVKTRRSAQKKQFSRRALSLSLWWKDYTEGMKGW